MMSSFEFHNLDKTFSREGFDCGSSELNAFLYSKARQNQTANFNRTFVAIRSGDPTKRVLGYYCLSMGEVDLSALPLALQKKLPKHPVPIVRMGRLAVDNSTKGQGLGRLLLVDAMLRIQRAAESIGAYALFVDAKDETAKSFYKKFGFIELLDEPMSLFLPLASFPR